MTKLYKHTNCTDAAIEILKLAKLKDTCILEVEWWNVVNPANKFKLGLRENIEIPASSWKDWKLMLD